MATRWKRTLPPPDRPRDRTGTGGDGLRIDKWLWFARLCKTRSLAATLVAAGEITLNDHPVTRPAQPVRVGDRIDLPVGNGRHRRRVSVLALAERRGPAAEAQQLYCELEFRRVPALPPAEE
ncbi:RNA-binding S4 domain-containing protein [Phaeospirillum tilakii]|uniref:RNA-binding S4 domain-containing protein n=1 Tax=Phaeospirillum tilakii TaxID=741673 RepID=A0ABW5CGB5_9PROT